MGQIFYAVAYDIENKECSVANADKFHANCYIYSWDVVGIHYLLRQKPYRVMWGGDYVLDNNEIANITTEEQFIGVSTYLHPNYLAKKRFCSKF